MTADYLKASALRTSADLSPNVPSVRRRWLLLIYQESCTDAGKSNFPSEKKMAYFIYKAKTEETM